MSDLTAHSLSVATEKRYKPLVTVGTLRAFMGLIFAFVAVGLWLAPGASDVSSAMLLKTGFTGVLSICAIAAFFPRR